MRRLNLLGAVAVVAALISTPVLAQEAEGVIGPGSRYGLEPEPGPTYYGPGYYRAYGFDPFDAAAGVVDGAANTAGAIATAPFRAADGRGSYAMAQGNSYCAERYRSYDPATGTFMGYDGRRHPCR